jgi:hypothetical protein
MIELSSALIDRVGGVSRLLLKNAKKASENKQNYTEKLEKASGEDVFKYILLINVSALEGYVLQTRLQAEQSFRPSHYNCAAVILCRHRLMQNMKMADVCLTCACVELIKLPQITPDLADCDLERLPSRCASFVVR